MTLEDNRHSMELWIEMDFSHRIKIFDIRTLIKYTTYAKVRIILFFGFIYSLQPILDDIRYFGYRQLGKI